MKAYKLLWFIPAIVWMIIIFAYSNQNGTNSTAQSGYVSGGIIDIIDEVFHLNLPQETKERIDNTLNSIIRKIAHFMEFFILALFIFMPVRNVFGVDGKWAYIICTASVFLYASSDEIHQYFVPGRFASFLDVCLDTSGAICCCFIIFLIKRAIAKHKRKHMM